MLPANYSLFSFYSRLVTSFSDHKERLLIWCLSVVIGLTLCLQYYAAFVSRLASRYSSLFEIAHPPLLYPFLDYPMYASARYAGDSEDRPFIVGILDDSTTVPIGPTDLGICTWHFRLFSNAIRGDDLEMIGEFVRLWEKWHPQKLQALRLEDHPLVFSGEIMEWRPPQNVKTVMLAKVRDAQR